MCVYMVEPFPTVAKTTVTGIETQSEKKKNRTKSTHNLLSANDSYINVCALGCVLHNTDARIRQQMNRSPLARKENKAMIFGNVKTDFACENQPNSNKD